jgi:hypothetical protein
MDVVELAQISSALFTALDEARRMIASGMLGTELSELLRHARELHELLLEDLADPQTGEFAARLARVLGARIDGVEALFKSKLQ